MARGSCDLLVSVKDARQKCSVTSASIWRFPQKVLKDTGPGLTLFEIRAISILDVVTL